MPERYPPFRTNKFQVQLNPTHPAAPSNLINSAESESSPAIGGYMKAKLSLVARVKDGTTMLLRVPIQIRRPAIALSIWKCSRALRMQRE